MSSRKAHGALAYARNFAAVVAQGESWVELQYDLDVQAWPWLELPQHHPVVLNKYQYFSAVTASLALGAMHDDCFNALTTIRWRCAPAAFVSAHARRGRCEVPQGVDGLGFRLVLLDADGTHLAEMSGDGVEVPLEVMLARRDKARIQARENAWDFAVDCIAPEQAGLPPDGRSFVGSPLDWNGARAIPARVTAQAGFRPVHPFHTGSGDHVNAAQLFDCALQAAHVVLEADQPLRCLGCEASFRRFVELDIPFTLTPLAREDGPVGTRLTLALAQSGFDNAVVTMDLGVA